MHSKLSMKPLDRAGLSDHELKRCRALAKGNPWQVWEEDVLWWSLDRQSWLPLDDSLWRRRRRWLLVETELGTLPASIWDASLGPDLPQPAEEASPYPVDSRAELP